MMDRNNIAHSILHPFSYWAGWYAVPAYVRHPKNTALQYRVAISSYSPARCADGTLLTITLTCGHLWKACASRHCDLHARLPDAGGKLCGPAADANNSIPATGPHHRQPQGGQGGEASVVCNAYGVSACPNRARRRARRPSRPLQELAHFQILTCTRLSASSKASIRRALRSGCSVSLASQPAPSLIGSLAITSRAARTHSRSPQHFAPSSPNGSNGYSNSNYSFNSPIRRDADKALIIPAGESEHRVTCASRRAGDFFMRGAA